jgi:hypothetical protein
MRSPAPWGNSARAGPEEGQKVLSGSSLMAAPKQCLRSVDAGSVPRIRGDRGNIPRREDALELELEQREKRLGQESGRPHLEGRSPSAREPLRVAAKRRALSSLAGREESKMIAKRRRTEFLPFLSLCLIALLLDREASAQTLVITTDTVINSRIEGDVSIESSEITVRIVKGGVVTGWVGSGSYHPTIIIDGGEVGRIGLTNSHVEVRSGIVHSSIESFVDGMTIHGGIIEGDAIGMTSPVYMSGGRVLGTLYSDTDCSLTGGRVGRFGGGAPYLSGGIIDSGPIGVGGLVDFPLYVTGYGLTFEDNVLRGTLADGTELGAGIEVMRKIPEWEVVLTNYANRLDFSSRQFSVGTCQRELSVPVLLSSVCAAEGLSFGVTYEGDFLQARGVLRGSALQALRGGLGPEYWFADVEPFETPIWFPPSQSGLIVAAIGSLEDPAEGMIPAGERAAICEIIFDVSVPAGLDLPAEAQLDFVSGLVSEATATPTPIALSCQGASASIAGTRAFVTLTPCFLRGDTNDDGTYDISDPITILLHLFRAENLARPVTCLDALDVDDDGTISVADAIREVHQFFRGGPGFPDPSGLCGPDPTPDELGCEAKLVCARSE